MGSRTVVAVVTMAAIASGCAKAVPEPAGVPPATPHVSWVIMYGDRDNFDAEFACQSTGPRECIIPSNRAGGRVYSDVHFYYHGAGQETVYKGTYRIEFFGDPTASQDVQTNITVRGEEKVANQTVSGMVTPTPGRYMLRLAVDAAIPAGRGVPIREDVPVTVR